MSIIQEFQSFISPTPIETAQPPAIGTSAPSCPSLVFPSKDKKPTIVIFLRHCGCPVAEAAFLDVRKAAAEHPEINFVAVSHSDQQSTDTWLKAIGGTKESEASPAVTVIVDAEREVYAKWGLGIVSWSHLLSPSSLSAVWKIGKERGIWNRPTETGNRWQSSGHWAVDGEGVVRWGGPASRVDDVIDVDEAINSLQSST